MAATGSLPRTQMRWQSADLGCLYCMQRSPACRWHCPPSLASSRGHGAVTEAHALLSKGFSWLNWENPFRAAGCWKYAQSLAKNQQLEVVLIDAQRDRITHYRQLKKNKSISSISIYICIWLFNSPEHLSLQCTRGSKRTLNAPYVWCILNMAIMYWRSLISAAYFSQITQKRLILEYLRYASVVQVKKLWANQLSICITTVWWIWERKKNLIKTQLIAFTGSWAEGYLKNTHFIWMMDLPHFCAPVFENCSDSPCSEY